MNEQDLNISEQLFKIIDLQNNIHVKNESVLFDSVKKLGEQVDDDIEIVEGRKIKIESTEEATLKIGVKENDTFCMVNAVTSSFSGEQNIELNGELVQSDMEVENNTVVLDNSKNYAVDIQLDITGKSENPVISIVVPVFGKLDGFVEKTYNVEKLGTTTTITALVSKSDSFYIKVKSKTKITAKIKYLQIVEL